MAYSSSSSSSSPDSSRTSSPSSRDTVLRVGEGSPPELGAASSLSVGGLAAAAGCLAPGFGTPGLLTTRLPAAAGFLAGVAAAAAAGFLALFAALPPCEAAARLRRGGGESPPTTFHILFEMVFEH